MNASPILASTSKKSPLAIHGGSRSVVSERGDLFGWPIITREDEEAALEVLRKGNMSGIDVTKQFEKEFAAWNDVKYALGYNNGTAALLSAMYAVGVRKGDEVICPSVTFWASVLQVYLLGGTPVFADIHPETLCIDPSGIERLITERTKAIVVVHYLGHPADMDPIMDLAVRHGIKVIEDVSHAQGGLYKGKKLGSIGHVAGTSLMSGKSLAVGEAGMMMTNDREIYDRCIAFGHAERFDDSNIETPSLKANALSLPFGGLKSRMHQVSSAVGRVQLRHYDRRCEEIRKSMNYFWDLLAGVPGLRAHRVDETTGSTMAGWYAAHGLYRSEELGGLSVTRFCEAVKAEGVEPEWCMPGCNKPLHTHPVFQEVDIYDDGKPTRILNSNRDLRERADSLPVAEKIGHHTYFIPWFKHYRPEIIREYASAFKKVAENAHLLLEDDKGDAGNLGGWKFFKATK